MDPPELLVPFQFLGRVAFAVHEVEDAAVLLVPSVFDDAKGDLHALVNDVLPVEADSQIHHEPQGLQIVTRIDAPSFETIHQRAVWREIFHHHAQVRLVEDVEDFVERFFYGLVQQ